MPPSSATTLLCSSGQSEPKQKTPKQPQDGQTDGHQGGRGTAPPYSQENTRGAGGSGGTACCIPLVDAILNFPVTKGPSLFLLPAPHAGVSNSSRARARARPLPLCKNQTGSGGKLPLAVAIETLRLSAENPNLVKNGRI